VPATPVGRAGREERKVFRIYVKDIMFLTIILPITKPTSGLLALRAAAADTGELRMVLSSAILLVFFVRQGADPGEGILASSGT